MRIGHARPSSALLGAAEPVATRAIFVSVEGSLGGTPRRRENRAIPSQAGLFSGQDEAAGSSPARPTTPGLTCGSAHRWSLRPRLLPPGFRSWWARDRENWGCE